MGTRRGSKGFYQGGCTGKRIASKAVYVMLDCVHLLDNDNAVRGCHGSIMVASSGWLWCHSTICCLCLEASMPMASSTDAPGRIAASTWV